jgi:hypothetical protein
VRCILDPNRRPDSVQEQIHADHVPCSRCPNLKRSLGCVVLGSPRAEVAGKRFVAGHT